MARGALGNDLYTGRRSFPFIQKRKVWFAIALALVALSILTLATRGLNRGIEFTGGSQFTVSGTKDTSQAAAAKILREKAGDDAARGVRVGGPPDPRPAAPPAPAVTGPASPSARARDV